MAHSFDCGRHLDSNSNSDMYVYVILSLAATIFSIVSPCSTGTDSTSILFPAHAAKNKPAYQVCQKYHPSFSDDGRILPSNLESVGDENAKDHKRSWFDTTTRAFFVGARSEPLVRSQRWILGFEVREQGCRPSFYDSDGSVGRTFEGRLSVYRPAADCVDLQLKELSGPDPRADRSVRCLEVELPG